MANIMTTDAGAISMEDAHQQEHSAFFKLPGEVRDQIYEYAFLAFEDNTKPFGENNYWSRPRYFAPHKSETSLLRTCKRVYLESWFRPFTSAYHTFWLCSNERRPETALTCDAMEKTLQLIYKNHGDVELNQIRFFAQLWALEPGKKLTEYLEMTNFHPRVITITLRHTDWWFWEDDNLLYIEGTFVDKCRFPNSLRKLHMELECAERRRGQIDSVAKQMQENWFFTRKDGACLFANENDFEVEHWQGSSIWNGQRWIRDESEKDPERINYYVKTVVWRLDRQRSSKGLRRPSRIDTAFRPQSLFNISWLPVSELEAAKVERGTSAEVASRRLEEYRQAQRIEINARLQEARMRRARAHGRTVHPRVTHGLRPRPRPNIEEQITHAQQESSQGP